MKILIELRLKLKYVQNFFTNKLVWVIFWLSQKDMVVGGGEKIDESN